MRVIPKEENVQSTQNEEPKQESKKKVEFEDLLVKEIANELYGVNFYTSLGITNKVNGLCGIAKFFWEMAKRTMCLKGRIKELLLVKEFNFAIPAIPAVELTDDCPFCQAVDYEKDRIERLYKLLEVAPCDCSKEFIIKLIKCHNKELLHVVSLAQKINAESDDKLLVQQEVWKLIPTENT